MAFGAGKQIEAHVNLHLGAYPSIRTCTIVNRSRNTRAEVLLANLQTRFPDVVFTLLVSAQRTEVQEAMWDAQIVVCATSSREALFPSSWVRAGTHVILIGSYTPAMREVDDELVLRAVGSGGEGGVQKQNLLVDSREACAAEAGELISAGVGGDQVVEIGEFVLSRLRVVGSGDGAPPGEPADRSQITMFKSVGVGLQDVAIACAVVKKAEELGIGLVVNGYDGD